MMHHVQGVFPGIPLVGDKTVEDPHGDRLLAFPAVFQGPGHRGDVGERGLFREEPPQFQVQVDPLLGLAQEF